ncbi:MAG TPA: hypothetical protein VFS08_03735 [Gemmatimonadaceae bacterium]|nr:hypothetical protein [Gemmatimonadaceae bacterium]
MFRLIFILVVGIAIGYTYGYRDARQHSKPVTSRVLDRIGGPVRDYANSEATVGSDQGAAARVTR